VLRQALFVAVKDLRYLLRDRRQLVWLLIMPPVFMYFIGTSTAGMGMGGGAGATPLAVYGTEEAGFVGAYLQKRLVEYGFELTFFDSAEVFAQQRRRLTLPAGLSDSLLSGGRVKLDLKHRDAGIDRDYDVFRVQRAAYATLAAVAASAQGGAVTAAELTQIETQPRALSLRVEKAGQRRHIPSGFEQAIPGILVMFVLMNMLNSGAILLVSERERGLLRRLAYAPIPRGAVVLGKWGGRMALGAVQVALGLFFGTAFFAMNWGPHWPMVVVVLMTWGSFCASCGLLLGSLGRTQGQVAGLGTLATMSLAALGGCWWPIEITPEWMQLLQKVLPSGWAMDAMHRLISFGLGSESVAFHIGALLAGALVVGRLGARHFRYQ
jgi:ABC-2 type transport system permease protein